MGWFDDLLDATKAAYHQVNPFDAGRTASTHMARVQPGTPARTPLAPGVSTPRAPALPRRAVPTPSPAEAQRKQQIAELEKQNQRPFWQSIGQTVKDIYDPNTEADRLRRLRAGQAAQHVQNFAPGDKRGIVGQTLYPLIGGVTDLINKAASGVVQGVGAAVELLPGDENSWLDKAGRNIQEFAQRESADTSKAINESRFSTQPREGENQFVTQVFSGAGSTVPGLALTPIAPGAVTAIFGASAFGPQYEQARESGKGPAEALAVAGTAGVVEGMLESRLNMKFLKGSKAGSTVANVVQRAMTEGVQEGTQSVAQSLIADYYTDVDYSEAVKQAVIEAGYGAVIGGGTSITLDIAQKMINDPLLLVKIKENVAEEARKVTKFTDKNYVEGKVAAAQEGLKQNQKNWEAAKTERARKVLNTQRAALIKEENKWRRIARANNITLGLGTVDINQGPIAEVEKLIKKLNPDLDTSQLNDQQKRIALANIQQQQGRANVDTGQKMFGSKKDLAKLRKIDLENIQEIEDQGERVAASLVTKKRVLGEDADYKVNRTGNPAIEQYRKLMVSAIPSRPAQNAVARRFFVESVPQFMKDIKAAQSVQEMQDIAQNLVRAAEAVDDGSGTSSYYSRVGNAKKFLGARAYNMLKGYASAVRQAKYRPATDFTFDDKKETVVTETDKPKVKIHAQEQEEYSRRGAPSLAKKDAKNMVKDFGFKGLEYGSSIKDSEATTHMQKFGDSMLDLEQVTGLNMTELNKLMDLGVGFGSRGSAGAIAHYEPSNKVINITRKNTADGSLAHEYGHALDDFLSTGTGTAHAYASSGNATNPEVKAVMAELMTTLKTGNGKVKQIVKVDPDSKWGKTTKDSGIIWESVDRAVGEGITDPQAALDKALKSFPGTNDKTRAEIAQYLMYRYGGESLEVPQRYTQFYQAAERQGDYWARPTEMLARALSNFVNTKLQKSGVFNNYVSKGPSGDAATDALYHPDNAEDLAPLFEKLFTTIKKEYQLPEIPNRLTVAPNTAAETTNKPEVVTQTKDYSVKIDDTEQSYETRTNSSGSAQSLIRQLAYPFNSVKEKLDALSRVNKEKVSLEQFQEMYLSEEEIAAAKQYGLVLPSAQEFYNQIKQPATKKVQPKPEKTVFEEVKEKIEKPVAGDEISDSPEAQAIWEESYQDLYTELSDKLADVQKRQDGLTPAQAKKLDPEVKRIAQEQGKIEDAFIAEARKRLGVPAEEVEAAPEPEAEKPAPVAKEEVASPKKQIVKLSEGERKRGFTESVKTSDVVSNKVKKMVGSAYTIFTDEQALENTDKLLGQGLDQARASVSARLSDSSVELEKASLKVQKPQLDKQLVTDAISVAIELDLKGDSAGSSEIYDQLAEQLTTAGQTVQAASLLSARTPEGMIFHARKALKKSGTEVTPEIDKQVRKLVKEVTEVKSDRGRNLRVAESIAKKGGDVSKKNIARIAEQVNTAEDIEAKNYARQKLAKYVQGQMGSSRTDRAVSFWKAGLLTGIKTQTGNTTSNTALAVLKKSSDLISAALDIAISQKSGRRSKTLTARKMLTGGKEGLIKGWKVLKTGIDERKLAEKYDYTTVNYKNKFVNTYVHGIFNLMGAADRPFYYAALRNNLYDIGLAEAKNQGLTGQKARGFAEEYVVSPPVDGFQTATDAAERAIFANDTVLSNMAASLRRSVQHSKFFKPAVETTIPFTKVPSAVISRLFDYSPVGAVKTLVQNISVKEGIKNQRALVEGLGEATTGTALMFIGAQLVQAGIMTLGYPDDEKERARWQAEGIQPWSIKVGGKWRSLNYTSPAGQVMGVGGMVGQSLMDGEGLINALATGAVGSFKVALDQSFLQGIQGALDAVNDPGRYAENYLKRTSSSVVPTIIKDVAEATDPMQRQTNNVFEALTAKVPGWRKTLMNKIDVFGNDLERKGTALETMVDPTRPSRVLETPVTKEVDRLKEATDEDIFPTFQDKKVQFTGDDETTQLSDEQVTFYQKTKGQLLQKVWGETMQSDEYKALDNDEKVELLLDLREDVSAVAKAKVEAQYNLGRYSPDYDGKAKLTEKQSDIIDDQINLKKYLQKTSGGKEIPDDLSSSSKKLFDKYEAMTEDERTAEFYKTPGAEYEYELADYERKLKLGALGAAAQIRAKNSLEKARIGSTYRKDIRDLYTLSKDDIANFVTTTAGGQSIADQLIAYDNALLEAGIISKAKFRYGIASASGGRGKKPWAPPKRTASSTTSLYDQLQALLRNAKVG